MEYRQYTVYFANLDTQELAAQRVVARDAYSARRNFMRRMRSYHVEPGQRYRVDVAIGWKSLDVFPSWMFDPDRVYQTAR